MVKTNEQRLRDGMADYGISRVHLREILDLYGIKVAKSTIDAWLAKPWARKKLQVSRHIVNIFLEHCRAYYKKLPRPVRK